MSYEQEVQQRWIARRDANAFTELVQQHAGMVFATCRRVLGDATEAEDVAQECFMELAGATKVVKPSLGGWLHRVAVFRSLNRIRADHRRKLREKAYVEAHSASIEPGWDDIKPHLDEAIAELPEKLRLAVINRFLEGKSQEDVAKSLGVSRSTAQYRIERGVEEIRVFLKGRGITAAATALVALLETRTAEAAPATLTATLGQRALAAYPNAAAVQAGLFGLAFLTWPTVVKAVIFAALGAGLLVFQYQKNFGTLVEESVGQTTAMNVTSSSEATAQESNSTVTAPDEGKHAADVAPGLGSAVVTGRVYASENGEALGAFDVSAYPEGTKLDGTVEPMVSARTGDDGSYALKGLSPGEYDIYAHDSSISYNFMIKAEGDGSSAPMRGGQTELQIDDAGGKTNADIAVDAGRCFAGQVVFGNGEPAAGVTVWTRGENSEAKYWAERISDANGHVLFIGLEPGAELYLQASNDGFASPVAGPFQVNEAREGAVVLRLDAAASIEGLVVDSTGAPAPFAKVWLRPDTAYIVHPRFLIADEAGHFDLSGLAAGDYDVLLAPIGSQRIDEKTNTLHFHWGSITRVYPDDEPVLRLALRPGDRREGLRIGARGEEISGRVTDIEGKPIPGASISIMARAKVQAGASGEFTIAGVPEGVYSVHAFHDDYRPARLDDVPSGTRDVEFVLEKRGVVEGQVVDARTGAPIPAFSLYTGPDRPYESWMEASFKEHAEPEGRFSYKPSFVTERIFVRAKGYATNSALVADVNDGQAPTQVTIALEPASILHGVVTRADGVPVPNASVFLGAVPERSRRDVTALAQTDAEGQFAVDYLSDESVVLVAWHAQYGYGKASAPSAARGSEVVKIVLEASSAVEGVITVAGEPLAGSFISARSIPAVFMPEDRFTGPLASASAETDAEGKFRLMDLPVGNVQITCRLEHRSRSVNVEVVPGETATVAIDFPPGTGLIGGRLFEIDGTPSGAGTLSLFLRSPLGDESFHVESDTDGKYQLDDLPAGSYEVLVRIGEGIPVMFADLLDLDENAELNRDFYTAEGTPIGKPTGG